MGIYIRIKYPNIHISYHVNCIRQDECEESKRAKKTVDLAFVEFRQMHDIRFIIYYAPNNV